MNLCFGKINHLIISIISLLVTSSLNAQATLELSEDKLGTYLGEYFSYVSSAFEISPKDVADEGFISSNSKVLNFGITDNYHLVKFRVKNLMLEKDLFIQSDNSSNTFLKVYQQMDGEIHFLGDYGKFNHDFYEESSQILTVPFQLKKGKECVFYFEVYSQLGVTLPFKIQSKESLVRATVLPTYYGGIFFGAMIVMIFYNLFVFSQTKDYNYLRYVIWVIGMSSYLFSFKGYMPFFFKMSPVLRTNATFYLVCLAVSGGLLFGYYFLRDGIKVKWAKRVAILEIVFIVVSAIIYVFLSVQLGFKLLYFTTLFHILFFAVYATVSYFKGYKPALYFGLGQFVMFFMVLLTILRVFKILPFNFVTFHFAEIGSLSEVVIFSFALASRIKTLNEEKNVTQQKLLSLLKNASKILENKVDDRTFELNESLAKNKLLFREVHHRVKNNLQMISSLLSLQSDRIEDESTITALAESRNRIHSMALIHQKLYSQEETQQKIDLREYVTSLFSFIDGSYNSKGNKVGLDINISVINLDMDLAINLGLILNEFITNSYKHAFHEKNEGTISIDLRLVKESLVLMYSDNGSGFDKDRFAEDSFGMRIVNLLVAQLKGELVFSGTDNFNVKLLLNYSE